MYCSCENTENCHCVSKCCLRYDMALGFLGAIILLLLGIILGSVFSTFFAGLTAALVIAIIFILIVAIVTLITKGCCKNTLRS